MAMLLSRIKVELWHSVPSLSLTLKRQLGTRAWFKYLNTLHFQPSPITYSKYRCLKTVPSISNSVHGHLSGTDCVHGVAVGHCKFRHFTTSSTPAKSETTADDFYGIEDVEGIQYEEIGQEFPEIPEKTLPVSLNRGVHGVLDVEDVVDILDAEGGRDICTIRLPERSNYVDYMVLATGRSTRHIHAVATFIKYIFKKRRGQHDPPSVKIEGQECRDWIAMDLGNVAVHLFLRQAREKYDLETLWTVGADFDDQSHYASDASVDMYLPDRLLEDMVKAQAEVHQNVAETVTDTSHYDTDIDRDVNTWESTGGWHPDFDSSDMETYKLKNVSKSKSQKP